MSLWRNAADVRVRSTFDPAACLANEIVRNSTSDDNVCVSKAERRQMFNAEANQLLRRAGNNVSVIAS